MQVMYISFILGILFVVPVASNLVALDPHSTSTSDQHLRASLLSSIISKINTTNHETLALRRVCELKLNAARDRCIACEHQRCQPTADHTQYYTVQISQQPSRIVGAIDYAIELTSYLLTGNKILGSAVSGLVNKIGEIVPGLLGKGIETVLPKLSHLASSVGHELEHSLKSTIDEIAKGGEAIVKGVSHLGHEGEHVLHHVVDQISSGVSHLGHEIGKGVSHLGHEIGKGLSHVGHEVENEIHHLGSAISHIFGKRNGAAVRRCTHTCPVCDSLDKKKHTYADVLKAVSPEECINKPETLLNEITPCLKLFNETKNQQLITRIEYDPASLKTTGGVVAFDTWYVTINTNGHVKRFQAKTDLRITDLKHTADGITALVWSNIFPTIPL